MSEPKENRVDEAQANEWLEAYGKAWERADPEAAARLFTDDAVYRSHIFKAPHERTDGIRAYWKRATANQSDIVVRLGTAVVDGDRVAAEWWTTTTYGRAREVTLPGVLFLTFDGSGSCRELREYWASESGRREPNDGWGVVDIAPPPSREAAGKWASTWESGWMSLDTDRVVGLYGPDASYLTHPFRDPYRGPEGAREYISGAFDDEDEVTARFAAPVVAGRSAAVEWWANLKEDGVVSTIVGGSMLVFGDDGLIATERDYWHQTEGTIAPPEGWGH